MKLARVYVVALVSSGFALAAWGCSSSGKAPSSSVVVGTGQSTSQSVSAAQGGTVTLAGSTLTIPPGALASDTTISITSTTNAPPSGVTNLSPLYQFGPSGLTFLKPVTVAFQFVSGGHDPTLIWSEPTASGYGPLASATSGSTLTGSVSHFSTGFVADGTTIGSLFGAGDAGSYDASAVWDGSCAFCQGAFCTGSCAAPYTACGTTCADTQSDPANCGSCGHACGTGMLCAGGACTTACQATSSSGPTCAGSEQPDGGIDCSTCAPGFAACGSSCVNTQTSATNCGACGVSCAGGTCQSGTCVPLCPTAGQMCANGACVSACPAGQTTCTNDAGASVCADVTSDSQNCGACGTVCATGTTCSGGACVEVCATQASYGDCTSGGTLADGGIDCSHCYGSAPCGSSCVTLSADPNNCGACGVVCPSGQLCSNGACRAGCPSGDVCYNQACVSACPAGWAVCAGSTNPDPLAPANECTPLSSAENCGACGHACPSGEGCSNGVCVGQCAASSGGGSTGGGSTGGSGSSAPDAGQ